jgi:hypothetical protein
MLKAFEDPKATSRNPATLAARTGVPLAAATAFLRDQAASQITKEAHKPPDENYAPTGGPRGEYLADVIYLKKYAGVNKKRTCILTLLGVNSRFVYARALTAADSKKTAEALTEILAQNDQDVRGGVVARIEAIRSDGGGEFKGEFAALLEERSIPLTKGQPRTHSRLARLDRYHGILRRQIGNLFAIRNSHVWFDALQGLVDNHNTSPSRVLQKLSPSMVSPEVEMQLRLGDLNRAGALRARVDDLNIEPGTKVRLLTSRLKTTPRFVKGQEATWTPELYTVAGREGVNSFRINVPSNENPVWPYHALQVVEKTLGQKKQAGAKIIERVVTAKRIEAHSRSEEEQAASTLPEGIKRNRKSPDRYTPEVPTKAANQKTNQVRKHTGVNKS